MNEGKGAVSLEEGKRQQRTYPNGYEACLRSEGQCGRDHDQGEQKEGFAWELVFQRDLNQVCYENRARGYCHAPPQWPMLRGLDLPIHFSPPTLLFLPTVIDLWPMFCDGCLLMRSKRASSPTGLSTAQL